MYAVVFDLDTKVLQEVYPGTSWQNAYAEIRKFLDTRGFDRVQGSTYFGGEGVNAVNCVLAVQDLTLEYEWFSAAVRDIRMLRIEENNDLGPAVEQAASRR